MSTAGTEGSAGVVEQAAMVARGEVSRRELVQAAIDAAERVNPLINAIILPRFERALAEADTATGPFAGVPIVVKDLGCAIGGEPHHMGNRALRRIDYRAPEDSAIYRRLCAAGFVTIGRTNTPEWGSTVTTEPLSYGPSRNPWNLDHSTGGSSGGSAAAVAAGIVAAGHANDGGGSIRFPASECGLVGLKPSRGRVSHAPDIGESWMGATTDGVVTRSVADTAAMLDVLSGYESGDPYTAPPLARPLVQEVGAQPGSLCIGVLDTPPLPGAERHPECVAAVAAAAALLDSLGHRLETSWPEALGAAPFRRQFLTIIASWTANDLAFVEAQLGRPATDDDVEPENLWLAGIGRTITAQQYVESQIAVQRWCRDIVSWWLPTDGTPGFDLLLTPTVAAPPPRIGYLSEPGEGRRINEVLQYTSQFNVTGQPAISLPLHWSADGLPIGVQLVAAPHREDLLVRVAAQLEAAAPWAHRRPPLHA
jgi:amidase